MSWKYLVARAKQSPYLIVPGLLALLNGYYYKLLFLVLRKRFRAGRWFRVYGGLNVYGQGSVSIGDNCIIDSKLFKTAAFFTRTPAAHIEVGDNVGFNGTSIQCYERIDIGDWCNIADAYIVDSKSHHLAKDRRWCSAESVPSRPVKIGRNVWISAKVVILDGVEIGENSVVGACSLVTRSLPSNVVAFGTPAVPVKKVPENAAEDRDCAGAR